MSLLPRFDILLRVRLIILTLMLALCGSSAKESVSLYKLDKSEQEKRIAADAAAVMVYRQGLETTTQFALQQTNFFPGSRPAITDLPTREQKEVLWQTWKSYLDYFLALEGIERYHGKFYFLSGDRRDRAFLVSYSAFLAKYKSALEFIEAGKRNPFLDKILNEPVPELGLPAGTYAKLKFHYLNVTTAAEFDASRGIYATTSKSAETGLRPGIEADVKFINKMGYGKGPILALKNAVKILQDAGGKAWLPVQTGVAEWMGDTKVYRHGRSLISEAQLHELQPKLLPGDVLLVRHEWYLSNVGLPGFWPHAALYIGTPQEREQFFAGTDIMNWVRKQNVKSGDFEDLLKAQAPLTYARSLQTEEKNRTIRILEAISEGVSMTALEHAADADSLVVLRPKLPKVEKAIALQRAFHYAGRPYDFNFDFTTDAALVCTELVFKAYEPAKEIHGLRFSLTEMLGRPVLPANEIVRQFDLQCDKQEAQFEFVAFLDGSEREGKAREATLEQFRESWKRPKWHVLTQ